MSWAALKCRELGALGAALGFTDQVTRDCDENFRAAAALKDAVPGTAHPSPAPCDPGDNAP